MTAEADEFERRAVQRGICMPPDRRAAVLKEHEALRMKAHLVHAWHGAGSAMAPALNRKASPAT